MTRRVGILGAMLALAVVCLPAIDTQPTEAGEAYKLKIANWYAPNHPVNIALKEKFLPAIKEGTGGKVEGFIYESSQLGGEREFTEGVRIGTIDMGITGGVLTASFPKIGILELPYVFRDYDHVQKTLNSPIGDEFVAEYQKAGVRVLAWMANGFRVTQFLLGLDPAAGLFPGCSAGAGKVYYLITNDPSIHVISGHYRL